MSIHSSLKISGTLSGDRNVWTRMERIQALRKVGRWNDGDKVVGLPKVRTRFKVKTKKQVKADTGTEGAAAAATPAAAEKTEKKA
jgi:small basic protein (TIGR04137 family)